jgi:prephenate dehydrogenase
MLECLAAQLDALRDHVREGGDQARGRMREELLARSASFFGKAALAEGSYAFERLGYLLADLTEPQYLSVFLPQDRPGSLRVLLSVFEERGINLESIHSSRSADGELHFRIAVARATDPQALAAAMAAIEREGIGRVVDSAPAR